MRNAGRRAPPATGQRAAELNCLEAALAEAGAALGTDRPDIQGQRVVELAAWEHGVALAHALLDGDIEAAPAPLAAWRADLDEQLAPLVDAVNAATRRPRRGLWHGVEDRIA